MNAPHYARSVRESRHRAASPLRPLVEMGLVLLGAVLLAWSLITCAGGCGASGLETQRRVVIGFAAVGGEIEAQVTAYATRLTQVCVDETPPQSLARSKCLDDVERAMGPLVAAYEAYYAATTAYAAGLEAADGGEAVDLIALSSRLLAAYRALVDAMRAAGLDVEDAT